ncbi:hypothetical protein [Pelagibius sp.]|uniref:hypothetical protein n=1 Tax=Pelagibius sp. TaxID=1931238 RepID=UPI003BB1DBA0
MDYKDLPNIGEPGTAAAFQLDRLRGWGLEDLASACTTREQALLAHHCALYVRMVWQELFGEESEPPSAAIRHCVGELIGKPGMLARAERAAHLDSGVDYRVLGIAGGADEDRDLRDAVAAALREHAPS